jgi:hypothetical protein
MGALHIWAHAFLIQTVGNMLPRFGIAAVPNVASE